MSSVPVYLGFWHDYSRGDVHGWTLTLSVRWGGYLVAALSTFVGLVGTCFWDLVAFGVHQWRAKSGDEDGLFFQQQVIYRNPASAAGAFIDILKICWAWSPRRSGWTRTRKLRRRSLYLSIPPLLVFVGFTAAGVFVGEVANPNYRSNDVKIKPPNCGFVAYDITPPAGSRDFVLHLVNDTLAARAYARNCYGPNTTLGACSLYPRQTLPYTVSEVKCPFGKDPNGQSLCISKTALSADTGLLDTNSHLGINTTPKNRLFFRKSATCSPINARPYAQSSTELGNADPVWTFYLGPIGNLNYTYQYNTRTKLDLVGYQMQSYTSLDGESAGVWIPIAALNVSNADTTANVLASNSISYYAPVEDLWFSAHMRLNVTNLNPVYQADDYVNVMGCIDQYQLCNPANFPYRCTILGSQKDLVLGSLGIGLNDYQMATADRLRYSLSYSTMYETVNYLGPSALLANDRVFKLLSTGLPANQWQIEFEGWFETSLSRVQATTVEWAANTANLGPYGYVVNPDPKSDPISKAAYDLCSNQRIRNTGSYQSFSTLGLVIVISVGTTIIILSLTVELCVVRARKRRRRHNRESHDYREIARIADRKLQLQRVLLMSADPQGRWARKMDDIPVTDGSSRFPLPTRVKGGDDFHYSRSPTPIPMQERNSTVEETGTGQGSDNSAPNVRPALLLQGEGSQTPLMADQRIVDHGDPRGEIRS